MSLAPLILGFSSVFIWIGISKYNGTFKYLKVEMISTLIIVFVLINPKIVQMMFSSMNCT